MFNAYSLTHSFIHSLTHPLTHSGKYSVALSTVEKEFARMTEKGATAGIDATDFGHRKAVESQLLVG